MGRHDKTLAAIFVKPTRSDVRWTAAVALVRNLGGVVEQRAGSRVAFSLGAATAILHQPHPGDVMKKYAVEALRDFLTAAGHAPSEESTEVPADEEDE
jgi:hypothetical protein